MVGTIDEILTEKSITLAEADELLATYPAIGTTLAEIAARVRDLSDGVEIVRFSARELVRNWDPALEAVEVGRVVYTKTSAGAYRVCRLAIEKSSGTLIYETSIIDS